ncbi:MAG: hypothetical protein ACLQMF_20085 [Rectinemataceae bacterium]
MSDGTKAMVRGWVAKDGGDSERTARWMSKSLRIGGVKECRALIAEAMAN